MVGTTFVSQDPGEYDAPLDLSTWIRDIGQRAREAVERVFGPSREQEQQQAAAAATPWLLIGVIAIAAFLLVPKVLRR